MRRRLALAVVLHAAVVAGQGDPTVLRTEFIGETACFPS
jgi:hypothetical protein